MSFAGRALLNAWRTGKKQWILGSVEGAVELIAKVGKEDYSSPSISSAKSACSHMTERKNTIDAVLGSLSAILEAAVGTGLVKAYTYRALQWVNSEIRCKR